LSSVSNATGNFLTISGGVVHQRTASETRSDVGAQAQLNGTGFVKASGTTISYDNTSYLPLSGGEMTGAILMVNGVAAASNSQPTALSTGLLQGFGTFTLAADTDGSQNEFAVITSGYGIANATPANGLAVGFNTLTWKNNVVWHAGNITPVTSVTASSPLFSSGGTTPNITIQQASGSQNGFLSSTDWTTFNNKANSVVGGYLPLSGGTMTGVIVTPNGSIGIIIGDDSALADRNVANTLFLEGVQDNDRGYINFSQTTGNALGAINGGDLTWKNNVIWHAGNLTNPVTGTGTTNYLPKFTGASTIGNSQIFDNGTNIGIGTASPTLVNFGLEFVVSRMTGAQQEAQVVIQGNTTTDSNVGGLHFYNNTNFLANISGARQGANNSGIIKFSTNNAGSSAERMRITAAGNLEMSANSDINFGGSGKGIYLSRAGLGPRASLTTRASITWVDIANSSDWSGVTLAASGGNVLIGTTSDNGTRLQINGGFTVAGTSALADNQLRVRTIGDANHAIVYNGTVNGPLSYGYFGSGLGWTEGGAAQIALMTFRSSVIINSLSGSGNRIVVANSGGTLISAVIGSGLAFDGTTLTATGGSSGSISGSGTSGTVALFTGTSSIGNSVITQSSNNILIGTSTNAGSFRTIFSNSTGSGAFIGITNQTGDTGNRALRLGFSGGATLATIQGTSINVADNVNIALQLGGGNVGVGTNPNQKLHIAGTTKVAPATPASNAVSTLILSNDFDNDNAIKHTSDKALSFEVTGSERMRIASGGNIGIGPTNPFNGATSLRGIAISDRAGIFQLNVNNQTYVTSNLYYDGTDWRRIVASGGSFMQVGDPSGGEFKVFGSTSGTAGSVASLTERMVINSSGNVLIGNTSDNGNRLRVNGTIFSDSSITATSFFESSDATLKTLVQDDYQAKGIESVVAKLYIKNGKQELGYYAQDLQGILPSAVNKGSDGLLNLSYREVHTAKIAYLEEEIRQIKKRYEIN
jgi:hypothetical protein